MLPPNSSILSLIAHQCSFQWKPSTEVNASLILGILFVWVAPKKKFIRRLRRNFFSQESGPENRSDSSARNFDVRPVRSWLRPSRRRENTAAVSVAESNPGILLFCSTSLPLAGTGWVWSINYEAFALPLLSRSKHCADKYLCSVRYSLKRTPEPRLEPRAAGREARMLPLCYAAPLLLFFLSAKFVFTLIGNLWEIFKSTLVGVSLNYSELWLNPGPIS